MNVNVPSVKFSESLTNDQKKTTLEKESLTTLMVKLGCTKQKQFNVPLSLSSKQIQM